MSRSHFKGPFICPQLLFPSDKKKIVKLFSKNTTILPEYIDYTFNVYNGKNFIKIKVTEPMIGYCFGEFIYTRTQHQFKKKKKK